MSEPRGTLKWIAIAGNEKTLHVNTGEGYKPYTALPYLMQPDIRMGDMQLSKGFRTAQVLLQKGFVYEPSDRD
jgi:hypothetical protein